MTLLQEALAPRSDQLNADDLIPGPRTLKITGARIVEGERGGKRVIIHYEGDNGKPFKPCKTMGRAMVMVWAIVDDADEAKVSAQFIGKSITVFRDPTVDFGNEKGIGGIRISHMSHIDSPKTVKLTVSQGKKAQFVFQPLTAEVRNMPDKAAEWVASFLADLVQQTTAEAVEAQWAQGAKAIAKLEKDRPELHAQVTASYDAKLASVGTTEDDDDPFGPAADPADADTRADDQ